MYEGESAYTPVNSFRTQTSKSNKKQENIVFFTISCQYYTHIVCQLVLYILY